MAELPAIFSIPGFVDVIDEPDLKAVRLRYQMLFDETGRDIPKAVRAAASYAIDHNLKNWIADTQAVRDDLSETDASWVSGEAFRNILINSPIETFVLIAAPDDAAGVDNSWIPEWRENTEQGFAGKIAVHVLDEQKMMALFGA